MNELVLPRFCFEATAMPAGEGYLALGSGAQLLHPNVILYNRTERCIKGMRKVVARSNNSKSWALAVAGLGSLLFTGCSQSEPVPEPSVEESVQLDSEQLHQWLTQFSSADNEAKVLTEKQLRASIPKAQEWIDRANVNPQKCGVTIAQPISGQLDHASLGAVELQDSFLMVSVYDNPDILNDQWQAMKDSWEECARYSVSVGGQTRAYHVAQQPMDSDAAQDQSYVVTSSDGTKTRQQLVIRSMDANVLIGIQQPTTQGQTTEQVRIATTKINKLLSELVRAE